MKNGIKIISIWNIHRYKVSSIVHFKEVISMTREEWNEFAEHLAHSSIHEITELKGDN
ncbi:hypothetical protein_gp206 [Bacillus phage vB_BceM_WH1]|nr:hypothetical protein_gp206 [Bacillus phage vB_BceM_WH1]